MIMRYVKVKKLNSESDVEQILKIRKYKANTMIFNTMELLYSELKSGCSKNNNSLSTKEKTDLAYAIFKQYKAFDNNIKEDR